MYKLTNDPDTIVEIETGAVIPKGHRFWNAYQVWLEDPSNEPEPFQTQEEIDAQVLANERAQGIEDEKESAGLRKITVAVAHNKIDQIFDGATTVAQVRNATVIALKKIIPFIIS